MHPLAQRLRDDHRHLTRVLDVLQAQLDALARADASVHTSEERFPVMGKMANGPPGRKYSCARPLWGRS